MLLSMLVSTYNMLTRLWREVLLWCAIIMLALIALRILKACRMRLGFSRALRDCAKENGADYRALRPSLLSLFLNLSGYDVEIECRGTLYRIKYYPGIVLGRAVHLENARSTRRLSRLALRRAVDGKMPHGVGCRLKFDNSIQENTVNILVFSPKPLALTEKNTSGTVWELDMENGEIFDGVYLFSDDILRSRMERLLAGYITSLRGENE